MHYEVRGRTTKSNHEREGMSCIGRSLVVRDHKVIERSAASVSSLAREVGMCSFRYIFYHGIFRQGSMGAEVTKWPKIVYTNDISSSNTYVGAD